MATSAKKRTLKSEDHQKLAEVTKDAPAGFDLQSIHYDQDKAIKGEWFDFLSELGEPTGAQIKVARANNPEFQQFCRMEYAKALKKRSKDDLEKEVDAESLMDLLPKSALERIELNGMVNHILLDWKGFVAGGKKFPYTKARAKKMLANSPVFRDQVNTCSSALWRFAQNIEDILEKN